MRGNQAAAMELDARQARQKQPTDGGRSPLARTSSVLWRLRRAHGHGWYARRTTHDESAVSGGAVEVGLVPDRDATRMRSTATKVPCWHWGQRVTSIPVKRMMSATASGSDSLLGGVGCPSNS